VDIYTGIQVYILETLINYTCVVFMEKYKVLALTIVVIALIISLATAYLNNNLKKRIEYYETPRGVVERAWNNSKEREYWLLKNISSFLNIIGLTCIVIVIAGMGLYINDIQAEDTEEEQLI